MNLCTHRTQWWEQEIGRLQKSQRLGCGSQMLPDDIWCLEWQRPVVCSVNAFQRFHLTVKKM